MVSTIAKIVSSPAVTREDSHTWSGATRSWRRTWRAAASREQMNSATAPTTVISTGRKPMDRCRRSDLDSTAVTLRCIRPPRAMETSCTVSATTKYTPVPLRSRPVRSSTVNRPAPPREPAVSERMATTISTEKTTAARSIAP